MARPYSLDLRERVVGSVASGESCRMVAALFRCQRCERCEVVAAGADDRKRGGQADGRQAALSAGGRARWLLGGWRRSPI